MTTLQRLMAAFTIVVGTWASARGADFSFVAPSGQTVYCNVVADGVELTFPGDAAVPVAGWYGYSKPEGLLVLPPAVEYLGVERTVVAVGAFAFYGCDGLTGVRFASGLRKVGASAFRGCTGLVSASFPATLDSLLSRPFYGCTSLSDMTVMRSTPPAVNTVTFDGLDLAAVTLHVACGAVDAYAGVAPWNGFGSVSDADCSVSLTVAANYGYRGSVSGGGDYAVGASAEVSATPAPGFFFACWSDGDTLNPRQLVVEGETWLTAMFFPCVHDTLTLLLPVHDTVTVADSARFTLAVGSSNPQLGLGVGSCRVPGGTEVEICALPAGAASFLGWDDGSLDNPRRVAVGSDTSFTALFLASAAVADVADASRVWASGGRVCVDCPAGLGVVVYDLEGRCLASWRSDGSVQRFAPPREGVYAVRVGDGTAHFVMVTH